MKVDSDLSGKIQRKLEELLKQAKETTDRNDVIVLYSQALGLASAASQELVGLVGDISGVLLEISSEAKNKISEMENDKGKILKTEFSKPTKQYDPKSN